MKQFNIDDDLVALVWQRANPQPFENLSFSEALRRVLGEAQPNGVSNISTSTEASPISLLDELLAALDKEGIRYKVPQRDSSPSSKEWVARVPELCSITGLSSWKEICDHLRIDVGGDSARRRLQQWVKNERPSWPAVPDPIKTKRG